MTFSIETIAIGDEILTGKISDTNSTFVGDQLFQTGFRLNRVTVVADDIPTIQAALKESSLRGSHVVCFGGLGPTSDDKTADAVAGLLRCEITDHAPSREKLIRLYQQRGREVTVHALKQARYPAATTPIPNPKGMAPGFRCSLGNSHLFFLPGVPPEMKAMFAETVLPALFELAGYHQSGPGLVSRSWKCLGIWESDLQRVMDPVEAELPPHAWLGYRTHYPENHLTLYYRRQPGESEQEMNRWETRIRQILAPYTFTEDGRELEGIVSDLLQTKGKRIALAESCTGGLVTHRLTRIPGSSLRVWGGFVSYQNEAKKSMLSVEVSEETAVSSECSRRLSEAALEKSGCDVAAAITGYVGPAGGTAESPIGTLYLCVTGKNGAKPLEKKLVIPMRVRQEAQWGASTFLLDLIRQFLESRS
jgi:nicotinamide-nucleotide amidase